MSELKIITWNCKNAQKDSLVRDYLLQKDPDIMLLQEVGRIPETLLNKYNVIQKRPLTKNNTPQRFQTAILSKYKIDGEIEFVSTYDWVNNEIKHCAPNLLGCKILLENKTILHAVSVYSPAWPIDKNRLENVDTSGVRIGTDIWVTDILWDILNNYKIGGQDSLIVSGDFNAAVTLDPEGSIDGENKKTFDRIEALGFTECLKLKQGPIGTFRHSRGSVKHQIDHIFVSNNLVDKLMSCTTGNPEEIFNKLSDHLPIITEFKC